MARRSWQLYGALRQYVVKEINYISTGLSTGMMAKGFSVLKYSTKTVAGENNTAGVPKISGRDQTVFKMIRNTMRNYKQLSKARLSGLVVATAAAGFVAASEEAINWERLGWTSLGTMLASSSANALNQIYEVVNDSKMTRTAVRPLPTGRMSRMHALAFAVVTGVGGIYILSTKVNNITASLGAGNILLYAGVYTPLKQLSIVNTWIGAVVGAVPPLMGWAGAIGKLDYGALLLAAGLYFWQMPHFMALAWLCRKDYALGGYKMLSLVDSTGKRTAACALRNCMYLFPLGTLSTWLGITSPYFAYESAFITAGMLLTAANFYAKPSNTNARILFRASLLHLPVFMAAFLLHRIPNTGQDRLSLLEYHAWLLGLGSKEEMEEISHPSIPKALDSKKVEEAVGYMHTYTPPLPLLPIPGMSCPSKASCQGENCSDSNDR